MRMCRSFILRSFQNVGLRAASGGARASSTLSKKFPPLTTHWSTSVDDALSRKCLPLMELPSTVFIFWKSRMGITSARSSRPPIAPDRQADAGQQTQHDRESQDHESLGARRRPVW